MTCHLTTATAIVEVEEEEEQVAELVAAVHCANENVNKCLI